MLFPGCKRTKFKTYLDGIGIGSIERRRFGFRFDSFILLAAEDCGRPGHDGGTKHSHYDRTQLLMLAAESATKVACEGISHVQIYRPMASH